MGASSLIRVFYVANASTGDYFVVSDNMEEYSYRVSSYVINLFQSKKLNFYTIGSAEMTVHEYQKIKAESHELEEKLIKDREEMLKKHGIAPDTPKEKHVEPEKKEYSDNVLHLFNDETPMQ